VDEIIAGQARMSQRLSVYGTCSAREQRREVRQHNEAVLAYWSSKSLGEPMHSSRPASAPPQAFASGPVVLTSPPYVPPSLPLSRAGMLRPIDPAPLTTPTCTDAPIDSDLHLFETNNEYFLVCRYCGASSGRAQSYFQDDYKDTHATDKSTARADAPPAQHKQSEIEQDKAMTTPHCGGGAFVTKEQRQQFGYAQERVNRDAAKEAAAESDLKPEHKKHFGNVRDRLSDLIATMSPMEPQLAAAIDATTERIYKASLQHAQFCHGDCQLKLYPKAPRVIANKCFVHTVEEAAKTQLAGVPAQSIASMQEKMDNHETFLQYNHSTQNASLHLIVKRLSTMDPMQACDRFDDGNGNGNGNGDADVQRRTRGLERDKHKHDDAAVASNSPPAPALAIQVRDHIARLSAEYGCAVHVRDAARTALNDGKFSQKLKENDVVCKDTVGAAGIAYLMLRAVEKARSDPGAPSAFSTKSTRPLPPGLDKIEVDATIHRMTLALPDDVKAPSRAEDELYDDCD
jgi:hypothetical protein